MNTFIKLLAGFRASIEELCAICGTEKRDAQMALEFLELEYSEDGLDGGTFLCLAVYDMLCQLGMRENALLIVKKFFKEIYEVGNDCSKHQHEKHKFAVLQINNNRFAWITNDHDRVLDIKELSWVERCPLPIVFVGIVLPGLFERAVAALEQLRDQQRVKASQQLSQEGQSSAS